MLEHAGNSKLEINILASRAGVIAATLLSFATPAADFRVERRSAIAIALEKFKRGVESVELRSTVKNGTKEKE